LKDDEKTFQIGDLVKVSVGHVARGYYDRLGPNWRGLVVNQITYPKSQLSSQEVWALGPDGKIHFFISNDVLSHC
jgi:hypothetical protein